MEKKNSHTTRVLVRNSSIYFNACPRHIVHNMSASAGLVFSCATAFHVQDIMVDLHYSFITPLNERTN